MKETIDTSTRQSSSFTCYDDTDIKISGTFVGLVWLESQTPSETTWERVPESLVNTPSQYAIAANDATITYRFNSNLESGSAVVYAGGVTEV